MAAPPYEMGMERMPASCAEYLMFVPFGLLLPMVFPRLRACWKTLLAALGITVLIEVLQYFTGRSADIDDVIMNVLGAVMGYGLFALLNKALQSRKWWQNMLGAQLPASLRK